MKFELNINNLSRDIIVSVSNPQNEKQIMTIPYRDHELDDKLVNEIVPWIVGKLEEPDKKEMILTLYSQGKTKDEIVAELHVDGLYVYRVISGMV